MGPSFTLWVDGAAVAASPYLQQMKSLAEPFLYQGRKALIRTPVGAIVRFDGRLGQWVAAPEVVDPKIGAIGSQKHFGTQQRNP